jgi:nicotinamidase-related amidase
MDVDRSSTALLLMDLQHDIVSPQGKFGSQGLGAAVAAAGTLNSCARALEAARGAGIAVVHVGVEIRDGQTPNTSAALFAGIAEAGALKVGSEGAAFMPEVAPIDGELVVMKSVVSAFAGTDLDADLRNRGIRNLVLCGVATNFVIEGTARQAVDAGFAVTILADGCSSFDPAWHDTALEVLAMLTSQATVDNFVAAVG